MCCSRPIPGESPTHAVVGNGDTDGFRGPWAGELDRWNLDTDTVEQLRRLGYAAPLLARVGPAVVAVSPSESSVTGVTATAIEAREEQADRLAWAPGRPAEVYVGDEEGGWLVRANRDGTLVFSDEGSPMPESPSLEPVPSSWPLSPRLGARGLPFLALSPAGGHLAVGTSVSTVVLGPRGLGVERPGSGSLSFVRTGLLRAGDIVSPIAAPAHPRRSLLVERFVYPEDTEGESSPELRAYYEWQYQAQEASSDGQPIPALDIEPVCNAVAPRRCVRARVEGAHLAGWDYFDPARPGRALGTIDQSGFPPGPGHVLVAPGGRWVRIFNGSGATSIVAMPRGDRFDALEQWVELDTGWVLIDPSDAARVVFVPFARGPVIERRFESAPVALSILDATHVLAWDGEASVEVLALPSLTTERTLAVGDEGPTWHCEQGELVDDAGEAPDGDEDATDCPVPDLDHDQGYAIVVSGDRAFWVDALLGDEARVHRAADDAILSVRVTTDGILVSTSSGVFEGSGAVLDHVVVREPGPVRTAVITTGAEARARFERPGLVAAFFSGAPLPAP